MAGRRKIYTTASSFRYKAKMYDYMSRGGRVPMTLAMEVVDAMGTTWDTNFGTYKSFRKNDVVPKLKEMGVPTLFWGIIQALAMKVEKERIRRSTKDPTVIEAIINRVVDEHGIRGTIVERALRVVFGLEAPVAGEGKAGEEQVSTVPSK